MNELIFWSLDKLKKNNIPNPEIDLRALLNFSKTTKNEIILSNLNLQHIDIKKFKSLLNRRLSNEPIAKIINKKSFWKDDFYVNHFVLDPRPETEAIIEESIKLISDKKKKLKILDIGTGSGALAISLAREFNNAKITAIDISKKAIDIAKKNVIDKQMEKNINLKKGNINSITSKFDLIVSNPPYLSNKEYQEVSEGIKKYEPKIALYGGQDGLFFYREFSKIIPKLMSRNAYFIIEIGEDQFNDCRQIFNNSSMNFIKKTQDLKKKDRIMVFSKL